MALACGSHQGTNIKGLQFLHDISGNMGGQWSGWLGIAMSSISFCVCRYPSKTPIYHREVNNDFTAYLLFHLSCGQF